MDGWTVLIVVAMIAFLLLLPLGSFVGAYLGRRSAIKVDRSPTEWARRYPKWHP